MALQLVDGALVVDDRHVDLATVWGVDLRPSRGDDAATLTLLVDDGDPVRHQLTGDPEEEEVVALLLDALEDRMLDAGDGSWHTWTRWPGVVGVATWHDRAVPVTIDRSGIRAGGWWVHWHVVQAVRIEPYKDRHKIIVVTPTDEVSLPFAARSGLDPISIPLPGPVPLSSRRNRRARTGGASGSNRTTRSSGTRRPSFATVVILAVVTAAVGFAVIGRFTDLTNFSGGEQVGLREGEVTPVEGGGDYAFLWVDDNNQPARWDPCAAVSWVIAGDAPSGGRELIESELGRVSDIAGLEFSFEGFTDEADFINRPPYQPERYGDRWAPVVFAWVDTDVVALTARSASTPIGVAAPWVQASSTGGHIVSGTVLIDRFHLDSQRLTVRHEIGHLVGLGHAATRSEIMFPFNHGGGTGTPNPWGSGDRAALALLGSGGCHPAPQPGV